MKLTALALSIILNLPIAGLLCAACGAYAAELKDDQTPIALYRSSVFSLAQSPVSGQGELELGALSGRDESAERQSLPYLFKLECSKDWGLQFGGEALIAAYDGAGHTEHGVGDTNVTLKRAFSVDDATAFDLEFGVKIPNARAVLGSGETDYTMNSILSKDIGAVHANVNRNAIYLGGAERGTAALQSGLSAALSGIVNEKFSLIGEWSGARNLGEPTQAQALFALTYSPNKRLTLDASFTKALTGTSTHYTLFVGVVLPLEKL